MIHKYLFVLLVLVSSTARPQVVLDGFAVSERQPILNADPMSYIISDIEYTGMLMPDAEKEIARKISRQNFLTQRPYEFLLSEDENWCLRAWYDLDLLEENNRLLKENTRKHWYWNDTIKQYYSTPGYALSVIDSLIAIASEKGRNSAYANDRFNKYFDAGQKINANDITIIRLKVDWNYEKNTGHFVPHIIGLGLVGIGNNGKRKEFCWFYYPELKWIFDLYYIYGQNLPWNLHLYFMEQKYSRRLVKYELLSDHIYAVHDSTYTFYMQDRVELEALFMVELLKDEVKNADLRTNAKLNFLTAQGERIEGAKDFGFLHGAFTWWYANGAKKLEVGFDHGLAQGDYILYYKSGNIKEKGKFNNGIKEGNWRSWADNGQPISNRLFRAGWMEGKQETFYETGKPHLVFEYTHHMVNGYYKCFYENGLVMAEGKLENGLQTGIWKYNIKISDEIKNLVKPYEKAKFTYLTPEAVADNIVSFELKIAHVPIPFGFGIESKIEVVGDFR